MPSLGHSKQAFSEGVLLQACSVDITMNIRMILGKRKLNDRKCILIFTEVVVDSTNSIRTISKLLDSSHQPVILVVKSF